MYSTENTVHNFVFINFISSTQRRNSVHIKSDLFSIFIAIVYQYCFKKFSTCISVLLQYYFHTMQLFALFLQSRHNTVFEIMAATCNIFHKKTMGMLQKFYISICI